ncbi:hypothetical protein ACIPLR_12360 [Herbaspirillum huttiense]|uniref:hypothetical protein n=1 Tax=Herbaspirillum huttiense TaxID=863372 RepID=UPI00381BBCCC
MSDPMYEASRQLVQTLGNIAGTCRATLVKPESLFPANLELNGASEFKRGMAAVVLQVLFLTSKTPQGRQAILDLGFKPLVDDTESPATIDRNEDGFVVKGADLGRVDTRQLQPSELPKKLLRGNSDAQAAFFKDALKHFNPSALEIARRSRMTRSLRRRFARCSKEKRELLLFAYRIPSLSPRTERRAARQR